MAGERHVPDAMKPADGPVAEVVVVDSSCDRFGDFVRAARNGEVGLHFCVDGRSAMRLARRLRVDAWIVAAELPDMTGCDLAEMLGRPGVFILAETYRLEDEQRALAAGVAGYLVGRMSPETILAGRTSTAERRHRPRRCDAGIGSPAR